MEPKKNNNFLIYVNGEFRDRVPIEEAEEAIDKITTELESQGFKRFWASTDGADGEVYLNREKYAVAIIQHKISLGVSDANGNEIFSGDIVKLKDGINDHYGAAHQMFESDELYFYDRRSGWSWDGLPMVKFEGPDVIKTSDVIFKENFK